MFLIKKNCTPMKVNDNNNYIVKVADLCELTKKHVQTDHFD